MSEKEQNSQENEQILPDSNEKDELTQEDIDRILQLPERTFYHNSQKTTGYYDEKNNLMYFTENGQITGEIGQLNTKKAPYVPKEAEEQNNNSAGESKDNISDEKDIKSLKNQATSLLSSFVNKKNEKKEKPKNLFINDDDHKSNKQEDATKKSEPVKKSGVSKKNKITIAVAFVVIVALAISSIGQVGQDLTGGSSAGNQETEQSPQDLDEITVIQVTRDMIPGEKITESDIQESTISAETYNQITLGGSQLYQWNRADSLVGKYIVSYLPKGQYMSYNNVDTAYTQDPNPWENATEGYEFIDVPVPDDVKTNENLTFGENIQLTITNKTVKETTRDNNATSTNSDSSLNHKSSVEQSYNIDTYEITTTICDLLDKQGNSLYPTFTSWLEIPAGEQFSYLKNLFKDDPGAAEKIVPSYITIKIPVADAETLGEVLTSDSELGYRFSGTINVNGEGREAYSSQVISLFDTIAQAQKSAAQEAEETNKE